MTIATTEPPRITTKMTTEEAEEITEHIRGNFDSLGKMLLEVQERKGFLALGYKSLESYCLTEFGKGKSRLYQVIEEARIEEEIISELSSEETGQKSLKMPGTYLRTLKNLSLPGQKVEAIKLANLLAEQEGRKRATKLHLQVAALKVGGQGSEQLRKSIEEMGFAKGVEVEFLGGYNKGERGIIRKIDKKGQVYVEVYSGNSVPIAWDVDAFKIVCPEDKPKVAATEDTVSIGDSVKIFSSNHRRGKTGKISARISSKRALVEVDGESGASEIPYAELELIQVLEEQQPAQSWDKDLMWDVPDKGSWFYSKDDCSIRSFGCPGITFHPDTNKKKFAGPSEWLKWWEERHGCELAGDLLNSEQIATLVMTAAIRMTEGEKQKFLQRVNVLLTTTVTKCETTKLLTTTVTKCETTKLAANTEYASTEKKPTEQIAETLTASTEQVSGIANDSREVSNWVPLLESAGFYEISFTRYLGAFHENYQGWDIYFEYNGGVSAINITHPEKGEFTCDGDDFNSSLTDEEEAAAWTKDVIDRLNNPNRGRLSFQSENAVENPSPGDAAIPVESLEEDTTQTGEPNQNWQKDWLDKTFPIRPEIAHSTTQGSLCEQIEQKIESLLDKADELVKGLDSKSNSKKTKREVRLAREKEIKSVRQSIKDLEAFRSFQIGMLVSHQRNPSQIGIIANLTLSIGKMPEVWVKWEEDSTGTPEIVSLISIQDEAEEW